MDTRYFTHSHHIETPIAMTDTAGALVWRVEYRPFGGVYSQSAATIKNNLRFPGQYFDEESGLAQNGFRDYSAKLGRYIEPDPIGIVGGMNEYSYVANTPINGYDPLGLLAIIGCLAQDESRIRKAAQDADAASQTCIDCKDRAKFRNSIRNISIHCSWSTYAPSDPPQKACGYHKPGDSHNIYITVLGLYDSTGSGSCRPLKSTILHETFHTLGTGKEYRDPNAEPLEKKCFPSGY